MVEWLLTGAPPPPNKDITQGELAQLEERRHGNPEVAGSNPTPVNVSLFIQNVYKLFYLLICFQSLK